MTDAYFADRADAGRQLARRLREVALSDVVVLGLPRGGVPVAYEVAQALRAPLDVIIVRKVGLPVQPELAMAAVGEDGVRVVNERVVRAAGVAAAELARAEAREMAEVARRAEELRGTRPRLSLVGKTALLIDDGIATGSTMRAACAVGRAEGAARIVVATPVAPPETVRALASVADDVIALELPRWFAAVGQFYDDFRPTTDADVIRLLGQE